MIQSVAAQGLNLGSTYWYVIANRTEVAFYSGGKDGGMRFVERLQNAEGQKLESELVSDGPGSVLVRSGDIHHSWGEEKSQHTHVAMTFASRVAAFLGTARLQRRFDELILVAEPRFLGLLREQLDATTRRLVAHEIHHEYSGISDELLRARVSKYFLDVGVRIGFQVKDPMHPPL